jgi:hypothetical protein
MLADDAVVSEPVSTRDFPAKREINRENYEKRLYLAAPSSLFQQKFNELGQQFPTHLNSEFIHRCREFARRDQGNTLRRSSDHWKWAILVQPS